MSGRQSFLFLMGTVLVGALVLAGLGAFDDAPKSPLGWLQYPLLLFLGWGAFSTPEETKGPVGLLPFAVWSWVLGMAVELSLTVDGTGIGGVHPDTLSSFLLAQGDYIPLAIVAWGFHRKMGCQMHEMAWIVTGIGLTEGLIFTGSVTQSAMSGSVVGTFLVTCYLIAIYMVFLLLPFRLCGAGRGRCTRPALLLVVIGFAAAFGVRLFWGLIYSPIVSALFDIPIG